MPRWHCQQSRPNLRSKVRCCDLLPITRRTYRRALHDGRRPGAFLGKRRYAARRHAPRAGLPDLASKVRIRPYQGHRKTTPPIPEADVRRAVCWRLSAPVERSGRGYIQSTAEHSVLYLIHFSEATEPHRPGRDSHGRLGSSLAAVADSIHVQGTTTRATVFTGPARQSYSFSRTLHYRGVPGSGTTSMLML
jgi:hypothetical protein